MLPTDIALNQPQRPLFQATHMQSSATYKEGGIVAMSCMQMSGVFGKGLVGPEL